MALAAELFLTNYDGISAAFERQNGLELTFKAKLAQEKDTAVSAAIASLDALIAAAPEGDSPIPDASPAGRIVMPHTGLPKRYRAEWPRPGDEKWCDRFAKIMRLVNAGGIGALIGPRGTGKTRLAGEALRNFAPHTGHYTTAMGLFLRIRSSFGKNSTESEESIVNDLSKVPLLVLDEIQERGNSGWEDRILTHVLDRRYGAERASAFSGADPASIFVRFISWSG